MTFRDFQPLPTISDVLFPYRSLFLETLLCILGSIVVAISAQLTIYIDGYLVPITGQTFGVLLVGALFGSKLGFGALCLYLAEGAMGLPVFAGFAHGIGPFFGPSGGYLLSFPVAAGVVGWLSHRGWDRSLWLTLASMTLATAVIFLIGATQLSFFIGPKLALTQGVLVFLPGAIVKIVAAALVLPFGWRVLRWLHPSSLNA